MDRRVRRDTRVVAASAAVRDVRRVTVSAPGGIGNIGPGLDTLGCAFVGARDAVTAERSGATGVQLLAAGHDDLPLDATRHTAAVAATAVLRMAAELGHAVPFGIALRARKGLPLSGGQGGSAASAVAGAVAANVLLGRPLGDDQLMQCCLGAEALVAGRHLDNIAPQLLGGIALVSSVSPVHVLSLPVPARLLIVLAHPAQRLTTADARRALPREVPLADVTRQLAATATMTAACFLGDVALFGRAIDDRIAEPARAPLLHGFTEARRAALEAGAYGASISGAGPTSFAVTDDAATGERVAAAMAAAYRDAGLACAVQVTQVDVEGARVEHEERA